MGLSNGVNWKSVFCRVWTLASLYWTPLSPVKETDFTPVCQIWQVWGGTYVVIYLTPPPPTPMTQYTKDTYISVGGRGRGCSNKTEFSFIILEICSASHQSFLVVFYRNTYVLFCAYDITVWHMASVIRPLTGFLRGQIKGSSLFSFIIVTKALFLSSYTIVTTSLFPISSFTIVTTISVPYFLLSL